MIKRWIRKFRERIRWFSWMYCAIDIIQGRLITMVTVSQTKYCQKLLSNRLFKKEFRHLDDHQRNYHAPSKRLGYIVSPCFWLQNRCSEYNISTSQFFLEHHESSTSPLLWNLEANHQLLLQSFFFFNFPLQFEQHSGPDPVVKYFLSHWSKEREERKNTSVRQWYHRLKQPLTKQLTRTQTRKVLFCISFTRAFNQWIFSLQQ